MRQLPMGVFEGFKDLQNGLVHALARLVKGGDSAQHLWPLRGWSTFFGLMEGREYVAVGARFAQRQHRCSGECSSECRASTTGLPVTDTRSPTIPSCR